jgi:hypothetical protein
MNFNRQHSPLIDANPFSDSSVPPGKKDAAKHADYVIGLAKKLANGKRPGVLATVDEQGMPHLRWMATLSLKDFPLLYTITSPTSRKIQHIRRNPNVNWMFSNEEMKRHRPPARQGEDRG